MYTPDFSRYGGMGGGGGGVTVNMNLDYGAGYTDLEQYVTVIKIT